MKKILIVLTVFCSVTTVHGQTFQKTYGTIKDDYGLKIIHCNDNNYGIIGFNGETEGIYLLNLDSLGNTIWQRTYDPPSEWYINFANSFQQTPDSGFIITGTVIYTSGDGNDICLIKTNSTGDILWTKFYAGTDNGYSHGFANEIIITSDNGFAVVGKFENGNNTDKKVFLIKTDINGNIEWLKYFGGTQVDEGYSLKQTSDGGYIIAGSTKSYGQGSNDVYLLRISSSGNLVWTKTYGGNHREYACHLELANDGGYILTGLATVSGEGKDINEELFLMKTDSSGNPVWAYTYGENSNEKGNSVKQTSDGGFIATGYTSSSGAGQEDVYLLKTDSFGNVMWSRTIGGSSTEQGNDVIQQGENYLIVGETRNFSKGLKDIYLIKTDSLGNDTCKTNTAITIKTPLQWTQGTGGTEYSGYTVKSDIIIPGNPDTTSHSPCVCVPPTADYTASLIEGCAQMEDLSTWADTWFWDFGNGDTSTAENPFYCWQYNGEYWVCLAITNDCGADEYCQLLNIYTGIIDNINDQIKLNISPNPFNNFTTIKFDHKKGENLKLQLLTPFGQIVRQIDNIMDGNVQLTKNDLPCGMYFVRIINANQVLSTEKVIVVD